MHHRPSSTEGSRPQSLVPGAFLEFRELGMRLGGEPVVPLLAAVPSPPSMDWDPYDECGS